MGKGRIINDYENFFIDDVLEKIKKRKEEKKQKKSKNK